MKDETITTILEQPEEGFVPYAAEAEAAPNRRFRIGILILIVLTVITIILAVVLAVGKQHNYYEKILNSLRFDYRSGEMISEESLPEHGSFAKAVSEQISGKSYTFDAAMYMLDEQNTVQEFAAEYHYEHTPVKDLILSTTGAKGVIFKKKIKEEIPLGAVTTVKSSMSLLVKEYCFGTKDHDVYTYECYDSYPTSVGGKSFTCEIWLMCDNRSKDAVHYTLYRYYDGAQLAAVRVLNDQNEIAEVYDIKYISVG